MNEHDQREALAHMSFDQIEELLLQLLGDPRQLTFYEAQFNFHIVSQEHEKRLRSL